MIDTPNEDSALEQRQWIITIAEPLKGDRTERTVHTVKVDSAHFEAGAGKEQILAEVYRMFDGLIDG